MLFLPALLAFTLPFLSPIFLPRSTETLILSRLPDHSFEVQGLRIGEKAYRFPVSVHLDKGKQLEISSPSGAMKLVFQDKTQAVFTKKNNSLQVDLPEGNLAVAWDNPDKSRTFTIQTKNTVTVITGTKLNVSAKKDGSTKVHVIEGSVKTKSRVSENGWLALETGETLSVEKEGEVKKTAETEKPAVVPSSRLSRISPGFSSGDCHFHPLPSGYLEIIANNKVMEKLFTGPIVYENEVLTLEKDKRFLSVSSDGLCTIFSGEGKIESQSRMPEGTVLKPMLFSNGNIAVLGIQKNLMIIDTANCSLVSLLDLEERPLSGTIPVKNLVEIKTRTGDRYFSISSRGEIQEVL